MLFGYGMQMMKSCQLSEWPINLIVPIHNCTSVYVYITFSNQFKPYQIHQLIHINAMRSLKCFCKQWCALEKWNYCRWTMNNHVLIGRAILVDAGHFDMYVTVCTHRFADDSVCYQTWSHSWRSPRTIERVTWTRHPKRSAAELQGNPIFICQCNNPGGDVHWEGATPKV